MTSKHQQPRALLTLDPSAEHPVTSLEEIRERICKLNEKIRLTTGSCFTHLHSWGHLDVWQPADAGEVREEAKKLIVDIISSYLRADSVWRHHLRALYKDSGNFSILAADCVPYLSSSLHSVDYWRAQLVMFSIQDLANCDYRDATRNLACDIAVARKDGVDLWPLLHEVAALSSDIPRKGVGCSTREWLKGEAKRLPPPGLDDKILAAWNGLMISAFARAGLLLGRKAGFDCSSERSE